MPPSGWAGSSQATASMVSNQSSLSQDWNEATSAISSGARSLGQTLGLVDEDVVPGDPQEAGEAGEHLRTLGSACERTGDGIKRLDTGDWTGRAADGFRANYLETAAPQWTQAADAFTDAGQALAQYQRVLAEAQQRASRAQADLQRANEQSRRAAQAHNAQVDAAEADPTGASPGQFQDPGAEARAQAQHTISEAKAAVVDAGDRAAAIMRRLAAQAPAQPGAIAQLVGWATDRVATQGNAIAGMATGFGEAVAGLGGLALAGLKAELYFGFGGALIDPEGAHEMTTSVASTVTSAASDPWATTKTIVGVDQWKNHPMQALGEAAPSAIATAAGGGGAVAKVASGASKVGKAGKAGERVAEAGADVGKAAERSAAAPESAPQFSPASPWHQGELPAESPEIRTLDEPGTPPTRAVPDETAPLRPSDPADQRSSTHNEHGLDAGRSQHEPLGPSSRHEADSGPDPSSHALGRDPHAAPERDTELPREDGPDEPGSHDHGPDDQVPHDEHHRDEPDAPEHSAHDLEPAGDEPRFEARPLRPDYHGEQHGGVFETPVRYLDEIEREDYKLHVDDDGLMRTSSGRLFDTTHAGSLYQPQGGRAIFVMDQHGDIFASKHQIEGHFHHSSFLGGEPVGAAGELGVKDGKVQLISNNSGHYRPTKTDAYNFIKHLYNDKGAFFDRENLDVKFDPRSTY